MSPIAKKKNILRLFSLLFACLIWVYVVSSAEIEVTKNIPIVIDVPDKMAIKNIFEQEIQYRIKGPGLFVRKFMDREMLMKFNTSDYYRKGKKNYRLAFDQSKIKMPLGVELVDVQPRRLDIELERSASKIVPIKLNIPEKFLGDNNVDAFKLSPEAIKVSGPRSLMKNVSELETVVLDKSKLNEGRSFILPLKGLDPRLQVETNLINVTYTLRSKVKEFTFSKVPIIFQTVSLISQVEPKVVDVVVKGDSEIIEKLKVEDIKVIADVPPKSKGEAEVELTVVLPEGDLELVVINPSKVKMVLE